jgi:hypothetical protein
MKISDFLCCISYHDTIDVGQDGFLRRVFDSFIKISLCDDNDTDWIFTSQTSEFKYLLCVKCRNLVYIKRKTNKCG